MKYIAYCTKGLEEVVKREITSFIYDANVLEVANKRIVFDSEENVDKLVMLKTVDDLGLFVTSVENINSVENLVELVKKTDFRNYFNRINNYRNLKDKFSVTASIAGSKLSTSESIKQVVSTIHSKYLWELEEFDHTNFDIRIFIDHKKLYISVRLTSESLQHRSYKTTSKLGSLKPTIAAAMVFMAQRGRRNLKIVDNFCGSGTILCEAINLGNEVYGGDIDNESVDIARNNLKNLHYKNLDRIKNLNATNTNWQNGYFDCAISNLPWDKQITVDSITNLYIGTVEEYRRILKQGGNLCLLVSKPELLIKYLKRSFPSQEIHSFKIGLLGQAPTIVVVS